MTNPYKHKQTVEDSAYGKIQELTGENFEQIRFWINQLTSLHYSMGAYDNQELLREKVNKVLSHDNE